MTQLGRVLIITGVILVTVGIIITFGKNLPFLGYVGHLPGDIDIKSGNFRFYFPWVTCLLISLLVSLLFIILRR